MDFQDTLIRLKDNLEKKHNFKRSQLVGGAPINQSTDVIEVFIAWLDNTPEALNILKELEGTPHNTKASKRAACIPS